MKKLIIAAAIVCAAVMAQAAATQWQDWTIGTRAFKMSDNSTLPNGTQVYLMDTKAATWDALTTILTDGSADYANLAAVLAGDEFQGALRDDTKKTYQSGTAALVSAYYGQVKDGKADLGKHTDPVSSYYAVLVTDGEKYLISAASEGSSYTDNPDDGLAASFVANSFADAASISGGWQTYTAASVPEPTSGLLLLLGVAGLALKRRRA